MTVIDSGPQDATIVTVSYPDSALPLTYDELRDRPANLDALVNYAAISSGDARWTTMVGANEISGVVWLAPDGSETDERPYGYERISYNSPLVVTLSIYVSTIATSLTLVVATIADIRRRRRRDRSEEEAASLEAAAVQELGERLYLTSLGVDPHRGQDPYVDRILKKATKSLFETTAIETPALQVEPPSVKKPPSIGDSFGI